MIRSFCALTLNEENAELIAKLNNSIQGMRFTKPEQLHITLKFYGELINEQFVDIKESLYEVRMKPFTLQIDEAGYFSNRSGFILYAGIKESTSLKKLQKQIEDFAYRIGIPKEKRKFFAHITLARGLPKNVSDYISEFQKLNFMEWNISSFILYKSTLRPEGPLHEIEEEYLLHES